MSSQKFALYFLLAASVIGLSFIFIRRAADSSCPQEDQNICRFLKINSTIESAEASGTYKYSTEDVFLDIMWSKMKDMSEIQVKKRDEYILKAKFTTRFIYIKDIEDGSWWREERNRVEGSIAELPFFPERFFSDFNEILFSEQTSYILINETICGDIECFRYQVDFPTQNGDDQLFVEFAKKDYRLQSILLVDEETIGKMTIQYKDVAIEEPEDIKIVSTGRNIFLEYNERRDDVEEKDFDYLKQFQQQRLESEGSTSIQYLEDTPTSEPEPSVTP